MQFVSLVERFNYLKKYNKELEGMECVGKHQPCSQAPSSGETWVLLYNVNTATM
jgi:hypothetical protein